jgi:hypothetical protein
MRPSSGVIVHYQAAKVLFLDFSRGGSCVGSGGVETCCSRGSHSYLFHIMFKMHGHKNLKPNDKYEEERVSSAIQVVTLKGFNVHN